MKPFVIDASMAAAWSLEDEKSEASEQIFEEAKGAEGGRFVPSIFWHEIRDLFLKKERTRGSTMTAEDSLRLIQGLRDFGPIIREPGDAAQVMALARQYELSAYDAAYLALAIELDAILATNDRRLARAARLAGVELRTTLDSLDVD